mgnify:CR=1 FL=1
MLFVGLSGIRQLCLLQALDRAARAVSDLMISEKRHRDRVLHLLLLFLLLLRPQT